MDINVRYFGRLAEIAGVDSELLSIENNVLSEALKKVTTRKPELEQELFAVFVNKKRLLMKIPL
jgi:molybdopterin converting factor small subunit